MAAARLRSRSAEGSLELPAAAVDLLRSWDDAAAAAAAARVGNSGENDRHLTRRSVLETRGCVAGRRSPLRRTTERHTTNGYRLTTCEFKG